MRLASGKGAGGDQGQDPMGVISGAEKVFPSKGGGKPIEAEGPDRHRTCNSTRCACARWTEMGGRGLWTTTTRKRKCPAVKNSWGAYHFRRESDTAVTAGRAKSRMELTET